jgi:anti-sigma regulatory factor (Ser/Thr protein kinase)
MATNLTTYSVCWRLSREPAQVRRAREQARAALSRWGLGEHAGLAELVVSELATNAVRHGHGMVRVCLSYACGHLWVDVHDDGAGRPARRQATPDDESGRGLELLDGLVGLHGGRRGVANDSTGRGKTVYVMICLAADPAGVPVTGASAARAAAACNHAGKPQGLAGLPHHGAPWPAPGRVMCQHAPPCPAADTPGRAAARVVAFHPEQGWSLLCNGVIVFDDTGALLPDGTVVEPHRTACRSPANGLMPNEARPRGAPCRTDAPFHPPDSEDSSLIPSLAGPMRSTCPGPA